MLLLVFQGHLRTRSSTHAVTNTKTGNVTALPAAGGCATAGTRYRRMDEYRVGLGTFADHVSSGTEREVGLISVLHQEKLRRCMLSNSPEHTGAGL